MLKGLKIFFLAAALLPLSVYAIDAEFGVKLGHKQDTIRLSQIRLGRNCDENFNFQYNENYKISNLKTWLLIGEAKFNFDPFIAKTTLSYGWVTSWKEHMNASYSNTETPPVIESGKYTTNHRKKYGGEWEGSVSLGYNYQPTEKINIIPSLGYSFNKLALKHTAYKTKHKIARHSPFLGLDVELQANDKFKLLLGTEYHFLARFKNSFVFHNDVDIAREDTFLKLNSSKKSNFAFHNKLKLDYVANEQLSLDVTINHRYMKTRINKLKGYLKSAPGLNASSHTIKNGKHKQSSWGISLGANYTF